MPQQYLNLEDIQINKATQSRTEINLAVVAEYAEEMMNGANFPPIQVVSDNKSFWITDGWHRYFAYKQLGTQVVSALVNRGSLRDAILLSLNANARHGLRRTNADKRKTVSTLLEDPEWREWSNVQIAKHCGVDEKLVRRIREEIDSTSALPKLLIRKCSDGREIEISNIGSTSALPKSELVTGSEPVSTSALPKSTGEEPATSAAKPQSELVFTSALPKSEPITGSESASTSALPKSTREEPVTSAAKPQSELVSVFGLCFGCGCYQENPCADGCNRVQNENYCSRCLSCIPIEDCATRVPPILNFRAEQVFNGILLQWKQEDAEKLTIPVIFWEGQSKTASLSSGYCFIPGAAKNTLFEIRNMGNWGMLSAPVYAVAQAPDQAQEVEQLKLELKASKSEIETLWDNIRKFDTENTRLIKELLDKEDLIEDLKEEFSRTLKQEEIANEFRQNRIAELQNNVWFQKFLKNPATRESAIQILTHGSTDLIWGVSQGLLNPLNAALALRDEDNQKLEEYDFERDRDYWPEFDSGTLDATRTHAHARTCAPAAAIDILSIDNMNRVLGESAENQFFYIEPDCRVTFDKTLKRLKTYDTASRFSVAPYYSKFREMFSELMERVSLGYQPTWDGITELTFEFPSGPVTVFFEPAQPGHLIHLEFYSESVSESGYLSDMTVSMTDSLRKEPVVKVLRQMALDRIEDFLSKKNPKPPKSNKSKEPKTRKIQSTDWPETLTLTPTRELVATGKTLNPAETWERFENYHKAKGTKFVDWDAAWRNWCCKAVEFGQVEKPNKSASPKPPCPALHAVQPPPEDGFRIVYPERLRGRQGYEQH